MKSAIHRVAVVAFDGVVPFDLSTPCEVFGRVRLEGGRAAYRVTVCGVTRSVDAGHFQLRAPAGLEGLRGAHTIVVPGVADLDRPIPRALVRGLRDAFAKGARVASICTGAFLLAASGLLDGLRATTHWLAADELARRHPAIDVDPNVLYVDSGRVLTSAGAAAGLDLCLHMVRRDFGAAVAADAARTSVMPLERDGGQSQFIVHAPPTADGASLAPVLEWIRKNTHRDLDLGAVARRAHMSTRTVQRRFVEQTGATPAKWIVEARVRRAQELLESTRQPIERIAEAAGFGSATTLRQRFQKLVGTSPAAYRRAFRA